MNYTLLAHLQKFIGETVTIFTTSGGASGCGFTGVLLAVNCDYVRLVTRIGTPPSNPLAENICGELYGRGPKNSDGDLGEDRCGEHRRLPNYIAGSVCDIPIDRIASFCHNAN